MELFQLRDYKYLAAPILGWLIAQSIKYLLRLRKDGLQWTDFTASGGMPSSHAAFMASLCSLIVLDYGFGSAIGGLSTALTMIVCYDAMDVRRATGQQTLAIRRLEEKAKIKNQSVIHTSKGHTPFEILAGLFLGGVVGLLLSFAL